MQHLNYFELLQLPVSFKPDPALLKKNFYSLSRQFHPDFFAQADSATQTEMALKSEQINIAFKVLSDENARIRYILGLHEKLHETDKLALDPSFLMQVMEINEAITETDATDYDEKMVVIQQIIEDLEQEMRNAATSAMSDYDQSIDKEGALEKIKEYYLKSKYLLRIRENISTFAHPKG